ncbi:acetate--CoA ligase family protein [Klebsiella pneumoniae]
MPHKSEVPGGHALFAYRRRGAAGCRNVDDQSRRTGLAPARIHGLLVQSMANRAGAQELRVVVEHDPVFGPLIMLGEGGVEWRAEGPGRRGAAAAGSEPGALSGDPGDQKSSKIRGAQRLAHRWMWLA